MKIYTNGIPTSELKTKIKRENALLTRLVGVNIFQDGKDQVGIEGIYKPLLEWIPDLSAVEINRKKGGLLIFFYNRPPFIRFYANDAETIIREDADNED